jgi:hypothetical protein
MYVEEAKQLIGQFNLPAVVKHPASNTCITHNCSSIIDYFVCHTKMTLFVGYEPTIEFEGFMSPHSSVRLRTNFTDCKEHIEVHKKLRPCEPTKVFGGHQLFEWDDLLCKVRNFSIKFGFHQEGGTSVEASGNMMDILSSLFEDWYKAAGEELADLIGQGDSPDFAIHVKQVMLGSLFSNNSESHSWASGKGDREGDDRRLSPSNALRYIKDRVCEAKNMIKGHVPREKFKVWVKGARKKIDWLNKILVETDYDIVKMGFNTVIDFVEKLVNQPHLCCRNSIVAQIEQLQIRIVEFSTLPPKQSTRLRRRTGNSFVTTVMPMTFQGCTSSPTSRKPLKLPKPLAKRGIKLE